MWWFILVIFLSLFLWLLFAPIQLEINSTKGIVRLKWRGIVQGELKLIEDELMVLAQFFFWEKKFFPLRKKASIPQAKQETSKAKKKKKRSIAFKKMLKKSRRLIKSFRLIHCYINLDSNDYVRNAYLYPLFYWGSGKNRHLQINFQGDHVFHLKVENRLVKILYAILF